MASFDQGFSKKLIKEFALKPKNCIIFMEKLQVPQDSLGWKILSGEKDIQILEQEKIGILDYGDTEMEA